MENLIIDMAIAANSQALERELNWLMTVLDFRFRQYFRQEPGEQPEMLPAPEMSGNSAFENTIRDYQLTEPERIALAIALAPHLRPQLLDVFYTRNSTYDRGFSEFGGLKGTNFSGFLPTVETALFVLAGSSVAGRIAAAALFKIDSKLVESGLIRLSAPPGDEPLPSAQLSPGRDFLGLFTTGVSEKPDFSSNFPAKLITTPLAWEDVVLDELVHDQVNEIRLWLEHGKTLMTDWGLHRKIKAGYRSLFYGPPGTGKTLTATLLGKMTGRDVYRIDLSMVVSKYIGETEKNLANVFDQAMNKHWILFFDEADSLFGKRTSANSSNDHFANQQVSYLLQRIEDYPGVVILATNLKSNIDEAFARRFQSIIHFQMPGPEERLTLWESAFSHKSALEESIDLTSIAHEYELSGGSISNIIRYCSLKAIDRGDNIIRRNDLLNGIKKEFKKEGKVK
ncbi:MAG: ATP-binding protein [Bacteroidia bacterium]|jgi:AAA+ superfamily predicted ATPase|nr:ATP-binding protein [Bacteroidia bacterium]